MNADQLESLVSFLDVQMSLGRPICCVTSGGTSVNLEKNCVRSLENFSTGSRGAASAERFLQKGYAVIFLSREGSLQPFARVLSASLGGGGSVSIDFCRALFAVRGRGAFPSEAERHRDDAKPGPSLGINPVLPPAVAGAMEDLCTFRDVDKTLLVLTFTTVDSYLLLLEEVALNLRQCGRMSMIYLAAAVSDFYIPSSEMCEHKIQSTASAGLTLSLSPVPKKLGELKSTWCPDSFVVSFKLETDAAILLKKASGALSNYGVDLVVANLLQSRFSTATLVSRSSPPSLSSPASPSSSPPYLPVVSTVVLTRPPGGELEVVLVDEVSHLHFEHISRGGGGGEWGAARAPPPPWRGAAAKGAWAWGGGGGGRGRRRRGFGRGRSSARRWRGSLGTG